VRIGEFRNPDHDENQGPVLPEVVEKQDSDVLEQKQDSHGDDGEPND